MSSSKKALEKSSHVYTPMVEQLEARLMLSLTFDLKPSSDSGVSAKDHITNVTEPLFEWMSGQAGEVEVDFDGDGNSDVSRSVAAGQTYDLTVPPYSDGTYSVVATFTPKAGDPMQVVIDVTIDTHGPMLRKGPSVAAAPAQQRAISFNEAIDATSLELIDLSMSGPAGVGMTQLLDVAGSDSVYLVEFEPIATEGDYTLTVGPQVLDLAGNPMNQDGDQSNGEIADDRGTDTFTLIEGATWFTDPTTINETNSIYESQDVVVDGTTLTVTGEHELHSLWVINGGRVTHESGNESAMQLMIADDLVIDEGAVIRADGRGYSGGSAADGEGLGGGLTGWYAGGGSHGGRGGGDTGGTYGLPSAPTTLGSGGAGGGGGRGGDGGGAIRLIVADTLLLNGEIASDGEAGVWSTGAGGGGAGGSIYVTTGRLLGTGRFHADGGEGTVRGYGGGGGRIAVYYDTGNEFLGYADSTALRGTGEQDGQPGTVGFFDRSIAGDHLKVFTRYELLRDAVVEYGAVTIAGGGTLVTSGVTQISAANFTIESGSRLTADGRGYSGGSAADGEGLGGGLTGWYAGGGSHGGRGGGDTGGTYGLPSAPTTLGSGGAGGGGGRGGDGGGAIRLIVADTLLLNGEIASDGDSGFWSTGPGGGGAGGSIFVATGKLLGSGRFHADGGDGTVRGYGGGGGRIAVYYDTGNEFLGYVESTALRGTGEQDGQPGTVGFFDRSIAGDHLKVFTRYELLRDAVVEYGAVTIVGGATLVTSGVTKITADTLTIENGSRLTADGGGYAGGSNADGEGPGAGLSAWNSGGGSHGGRGGRTTGGTYGSPSVPTTTGSGGGGSDGGRGGNGGGAIQLIVTDTLSLDGEISSDGDPGVSQTASGGGGAGGSIYVRTGTLRGSGRLHADGGAGTEWGVAGGGGGGRIAVYYETGDEFIGYADSTTLGGSRGDGQQDGQPGTVRLWPLQDRLRL